MYVRYSQFAEADRDVIRQIESKGHVGYIRYLLLRRTSHDVLNKELLRLSLSTVPAEDLLLYFNLVLYPLIVKRGMKLFYTKYRKSLVDVELTLYAFKQNDDARMRYLTCFREAGIDYFIYHEAKDYYEITDHFPVDEQDVLAISDEEPPDWEVILNFEKRYIIDGLLIDGKTPQMIIDYFADVYGDDSLDPESVLFYQKAFFNITRQDLQKTIELLDAELQNLTDRLSDVRERRIPMTLSERSIVISGLRLKITHLREQIKRLSSHYSDVSFAQGVLEMSNIREMFADIAARTYRRYISIEHRREDSVIDPIAKLTGVLEKASNQMSKIDDILAAKSKKTITEEMLDVVHPTLERVDREQREDMKRYLALHERAAGEQDAVDAEDEKGGGIIGFDD